MDPIATRSSRFRSRNASRRMRTPRARDALAQLEAEIGRSGPRGGGAGALAMGASTSLQLAMRERRDLLPERVPAQSAVTGRTSEAARRLFASAGRHDRALALHQREEALLDEDAERAESCGRRRTFCAISGGPSRRESSLKPRCAFLPIIRRCSRRAPVPRSATATARSPRGCSSARAARPATPCTERSSSAAPCCSSTRRRRNPRAVRRRRWRCAGVRGAGCLARGSRPQAVPGGFERSGGFFRHPETGACGNDWETVLRLCRQRADRTASAADGPWVGRHRGISPRPRLEGLAEAAAALEENRRDGPCSALRCDLPSSRIAGSDGHAPPARRRKHRAERTCAPQDEGGPAAFGPDGAGAASLRALGDNPGDAAVIALHARLVTQRDPGPPRNASSPSESRWSRTRRRKRRALSGSGSLARAGREPRRSRRARPGGAEARPPPWRRAAPAHADLPSIVPVPSWRACSSRPRRSSRAQSGPSCWPALPP